MKYIKATMKINSMRQGNYENECKKARQQSNKSRQL